MRIPPRAGPMRIVYSEGLWPAAALFSAASNISRAFSRNWLTRLYRAVLEKFEGEEGWKWSLYFFGSVPIL